MATEQGLNKLSQHCALSFSLLDCRSFTNRNVIELCNAIAKTPCTYDDVSTFLKCDSGFLRRKVSSLKKKLSSLRGEKKEQLLDEEFLQQAPSTSAVGTGSKTESQELEDISSQSQVTTLNKIVLQLQSELNSYKEKVTTLTDENAVLKVSKRRLQRQVTSTSELIKKKRGQCSELNSTVRLLNRRKNYGDVYKKGKEEKAGMTKTLKLLSKRVKKMDKSIKKKDLSLTQKEKVNERLQADKCKIIEENSKLEGDIKEEKTKNAQLLESIEYVETLIQDEKSTEIHTYDKEAKTFTTDTQLCVMNLLSEGVGVKHVNKVIKHVARFCGKSVNKLPSVRTINRIGDQRAGVSYIQISEELGSKKDTTLQSDETRKSGSCYEVFSVRDSSEKEWVIGLKDMVNKSSDNCLATLKVIINDINTCTNTTVGKTILAEIKNTMSDRAATEKKFHELLQAYREEILPSVYSNWDSLSNLEQESIARMNNFYCGLHILVNFAEVADKVIKQYEENTKKHDVGAEANAETKSFTKKDESSSVRLVRTACKCLSRGGDEKSGCYLDFKTFMNQKDEEEQRKKKSASLLVPFRGNRFNILFYNAEIVFYLEKYICEFFEKVHKPSNRLQKAVNFDIKEKFHMTILKALGICSKLVTAPFWRAMESKDCSLEQASTVYQSLHSFLERGKVDCTDIICGTDAPLPDLVKKDAVYERLIQPDDFDAETSALLQLIFTAWSTLIQKAAGDHLPGGKFSSVEESLAQETASVPRHNKFPERVFSLLDKLTRYRPAASTLCNESYIMFSLNKTGEWLNTLPDEQKKRFLDKSRKEGLEIRKRYKERIDEIEQSRRKSLAKKREDIEKKEHEKYVQREKLIDEMLYYGLWQYEETVDNQLKAIKSDFEKRKALKCQLHFRKYVLGQQADKKVFQISEKGEQYSIGKLTMNVKTLIQSALKVPKDTEHSIFLGRKIIHYQMVDNVRTPFHGRVISIVPGYPQWYNCIYKNDESVYVYNLAQEQKNGDLEIDVEELEGPSVSKKPRKEKSKK